VGQLCAVVLLGPVLHPTHCLCLFASKCLHKTEKFKYGSIAEATEIGSWNLHRYSDVWMQISTHVT